MDEIQLCIMKGLFKNRDYCVKTEPFLHKSYFNGCFKNLYDIFSSYYDEFGKSPEKTATIIRMRKGKFVQSEYEEIKALVELVFDDNDDSIHDTEWLFKETETYCRDVAIETAVMDSFAILQGEKQNVSADIIPEMMSAALAVSFTQDVGSDYFDNAERRWEEYNSPTNLIPYGLESLNILTSGGIKRKTLNCFLAGTNVGKSALMAFLAAEWLKAGYNVVYFSFEMSEIDIEQRIDGHLLNTKLDELKNIPLGEYIRKIKKSKDSIQAKTNGNLVTHQFPTGGAHAGHMKHFLKELETKRGIKADIVIGDYINISMSKRYPRAEGYDKVKAIAEEWRGLAVELDFAFLTATQVNREGTKKDEIDMDSTSESFGLPMTLDTFVAIVSNKEMAERGEQILSILKSRQGNKSKIRPQKVLVDFEYMRYSDPDDGNSEAKKHVVAVENVKAGSKKSIDRLKDIANAGNIEW